VDTFCINELQLKAPVAAEGRQSAPLPETISLPW
jgi:hypothetical protein